MNKHWIVFWGTLVARCLVVTVAILFALGRQAAAQSPTNTVGDDAVLTTLQNTIIDADYQRVDLEKVIDDLRQAHNLNIHVSWAALEAEGIRRDLRIEVRLKRVSLASLLDIVFREAGAASSTKTPPTYHVQDGVLIITTGEGGRVDTYLRTYDIADLIDSGYALRRFASTPVLDMHLTGREFVGGEEKKGAGGSGGGSGSTFGDPKSEPERLTDMERVQQVVELIQSQVDPDRWEDAGGSLGSLRAFNSVLYVRQSMRNHQRVGELLDIVRSTRPAPLDAEAIVVRLRADKAAAWRTQIGAAFPRLTAAQVNDLAKSTDAGGVLFRGSTSGFNGQGMFFSALTQRDVLAGSTAIVGQQSSAYMPVSGTATSGLELILLPLVSPKSEDMTVDIQMAWVPEVKNAERKVTLGPDSSPGDTAASPSTATVDQTTRSMRTVSSTTKIKLGEAIALSVPAELSPEGKSVEFEDWLIVRVHKPGS